jgi:hypothetical protein
MSGRETTGGSLVVLAALIIFLAVMAWGLAPYITSVLDAIDSVAR